jgi:hypothetical protein
MIPVGGIEKFISRRKCTKHPEAGWIKIMSFGDHIKRPKILNESHDCRADNQLDSLGRNDI